MITIFVYDYYFCSLHFDGEETFCQVNDPVNHFFNHKVSTFLTEITLQSTRYNTLNVQKNRNIMKI